MKTNKQIFDEFTSVIVPKLQLVSKRFAPSIESISSEHSLEILASPYIMTLVDGRRPTSSSAKAGKPNLQKILLSWIKAKGIAGRADKNGKIPTSEQLSFAMSKSMHLKGDLLFQKGGGNNIFDSILTPESIDKLLNQLSFRYYSEIQNITKR